MRNSWDHAIELKEGFVPRKGKVYLLSRDKREEVQAFVEDQLRKGYTWCGGSRTKDFGCNTDLCSDHKFRCQLCAKEFKEEVNQEMGRVIKMGIKLRSFISKS